eukprot:scaffold219828_cov19-Tisochrysis_lutea.AAC.1
MGLTKRLTGLAYTTRSCKKGLNCSKASCSHVKWSANTAESQSLLRMAPVESATSVLLSCPDP